MKSYIGTKVILAEPALEPEIVEGAPARAGYKVVYPDGYESWSPKDVFERNYREIIATERSLIFQGVPPLEEAENDAEFEEVDEPADDS